VVKLFACLNLIPPPRAGLLGRALGFPARPKVSAEHKTFLSAEYLQLTTWPDRKGQVDWLSLRRAAPDNLRVLLAPDSHPPPPDSGFISPRLEGFEVHLLLRTACALTAGIPIYRRVIGLLDPAGSAAWMLPALLAHYSSARVCSQNRAVYRAAGEEMMASLGAHVGLSDHLSGCLLVLVPNSGDLGLSARCPCPVLTAGSYAGGNGMTVFSDFSVLREEDAPPGLSPSLFAAALWELCGVPLGESGARTLRINGRRVDIQTAANFLRGRAKS